MAKVIDIRTEIQRVLKTVHPRVYFENAKDTTAYPYIVCDLPNSVDFGDLENFVFDIDFWDDAQDTTVLETLCDNADAVLHKQKFVIGDSVSFVIYRDNRINVKDDDERIRHKTYTYQLRAYGVY
jgi:hypothetical protein